ncbi:MAG: LysR substrate-binding domain-containing protein [Nevskia sp.]|nr:LysR substrate-binding domain-containing protein [Nevskia sp.]
MSTRLPLTALRAFEAVASHMSFATAAAALYVSPAAVSQQVRALEATLGYPLFERLGSSIRLTAQGAQLLPRVKRGFDELRRAMEEAAHSHDATQLTVSMLASFLQRWLLPRLPGFHRAHPDIDLRLSASNLVVDLAGSDFHAAIRFGGGRWPGLTATHLFDDWLVPVCSPEQLERLGPIRSFADLRGWTLLHSDTEPWNDWVRPLFGKRCQVPARSVLDDSAAVAIAAERGHGAGLARWSLAAADVYNGRLACAAEWAVRHRRSYHLVAVPAKTRLPAVRAFGDWLLTEATAFPPPPVKLRR